MFICRIAYHIHKNLLMFRVVAENSKYMLNMNMIYSYNLYSDVFYFQIGFSETSEKREKSKNVILLLKVICYSIKLDDLRITNDDSRIIAVIR